ncbi:MAG TPA: SGNH/GDSL hydrolase family protein [Thermoanaerobaculia bacterium]|nr:SGNH/GDSL hydrolase family protein [Thermoanaerobaculia bacterium]
MTKTLARTAAAAALTILAAGPLAAQTQTTFHKYVANGDSITAGVQGNCLVARNQRTAYPVLVANALGITDFQEPLVGESRTVTNASTACLGPSIVAGAIQPGPVSQPGAPLNTTLPRPYDNLGMPSAKAQDLIDLRVSNPAGGGVQASAALVLRNFPGGPFENRNAIDETNLLSPDLVSVWIGANDVLGAALAGVAIENVTMTPKATFDSKYAAVIGGLKATGRTLVVLNIPDVTAVPFATTLGISRTVGTTTVPYLGPRTTPGCLTAPCPIPAGSLVTLQAGPLLATGHGIPLAAGGLGDALPDGTVGATGLVPGVILYPDEVALIQQRTNDINATIASVAAANNAILIDIHAIFEDIKAHGYEVGGITFTNALLQGGLFSADGFHPSNIAHAIIADEIIKALNRTNGSHIPEVNFQAAFFTPNVPPSAATALSSNDFWRSIFAMFPPDMDVVLPTEERSAPIAPTRPPRGNRGSMVKRGDLVQ